jgi:hypothetical protein
LHVILYGCRTLLFRFEGRTQIEDTLEQGAEENIWDQGGESNREIEELYNDEVHNLYFTYNIIRVNKSRAIIGLQVGHRVLNGKIRNTILQSVNMKGEAYLENQNVNGGIAINGFFYTWSVRAWIGLKYLRM